MRDATNAVREAGEVVRATSPTPSEQAERLLALAEKGYEYGVKTKLEVDDANFNRNQARVNLAQARSDYLVANLNLRYAMGTLGEGSDRVVRHGRDVHARDVPGRAWSREVLEGRPALDR